MSYHIHSTPGQTHWIVTGDLPYSDESMVHAGGRMIRYKKWRFSTRDYPRQSELERVLDAMILYDSETEVSDSEEDDAPPACTNCGAVAHLECDQCWRQYCSYDCRGTRGPLCEYCDQRNSMYY